MKKFTILLLLLSIGLCELMAANTATLKDFSGDLKIIRLFKRLEPTVGMTLEAKDMIRTQSGKAVVTLPDQSTVNVGEDSVPKLTKLLAPHPNSRDVEIELIEGAGIFSVIKDIQDSSFVVRSPVAVAGVRGTSFMMKHRRRGSRFRSSVAVFKGLVSVSPVQNSLRKNIKTVLLGAMTKSNIDPGQSPSPAITMSMGEVSGLAAEVALVSGGGSPDQSGGAGADLLKDIGVDPAAPPQNLAPPRAPAPRGLQPNGNMTPVDPSKIRELEIRVNEVRPTETKRIAPPPAQPTSPNAQ